MLRAAVGADLRTVQGTIRVPSGLGVRLVDVLSMLPDPTGELDKRRTWWGGPERGQVAMTLLSQGEDAAVWSFQSTLPRRYGASGFVPGWGLFANGLWHPQPVSNGAPALLDWDVVITLPPGDVGALNGAVGVDTLRWAGRAERLALAVLPKGRIYQVPTAAGSIEILERGRQRVKRDRHLATLMDEARAGKQNIHTVIVETPDPRRLARPGPGQLFVSSKALRLSDGLWRYHAAAVRHGLLASGLQIEDPWARAVAAAAIADAISEESTPAGALGWLSWIPPIDDLLYDGTLPYFTEVFDETHTEDSVRDDLSEILSPHAPAAALTRRLDLRYGPGTATRLAVRILAGASVEEAALAEDISPSALRAWSAPCPEQDVHLDVSPDGAGWKVALSREAPDDAPPDLVPVFIDDVTQVWETGRGPDQTSFTVEQKPEHVALDPDKLSHQLSRVGDTWPTRWTTTLAAWIYELDLNTGRMRGFVDVAFRRQYDTRWLFGLDAETNPENLLSASAWALTYLGPLQNRRSRPVRLGVAFGPSLLDERYQSSANGYFALDGSTWLTWDTREDRDLPMRGHRLWLSGNAGGLIRSVQTGSDQTWWSASTGGLGLLPLSGRVALAGEARLAFSEGDLAHRKLDLGGSGGVQSLPIGEVLGDRKTTVAVELRWHVMRQTSVPAGVAWLSDLQLSAGLEGGLLADTGWRGDITYAYGWTAGVATLWDLLGARPTLMGVWFAGALGNDIPGSDIPGRPAAFLRFDQPI